MENFERHLKIGPTHAFCAPASNAKTADYSYISNINESPKFKDGQQFWRNSQATLETAMNDFNSDQFKSRMKKMDCQVNFYFPSYSVPES